MMNEEKEQITRNNNINDLISSCSIVYDEKNQDYESNKKTRTKSCAFLKENKQKVVAVIPKGLNDLLLDLTLRFIEDQPRDLNEYAFNHFKNIIQSNQDNSNKNLSNSFFKQVFSKWTNKIKYIFFVTFLTRK